MHDEKTRFLKTYSYQFLQINSSTIIIIPALNW